MHSIRTYRIVGGAAVACAALAAAPAAAADAPPQGWTVTSPTPVAPSELPAADPYQAAAHRSAAAWATTDLTTTTASNSAVVGAAAGAAGAARNIASSRHPAARPTPQRVSWRTTSRQVTAQPHAHRQVTHQRTAAAHRHDAQHARTPLHRIGTWTVHEGESLSLIAALNATTVHRLVAANADRYPSLATDPDYVQVGWNLRVPRAGVR